MSLFSKRYSTMRVTSSPDAVIKDLLEKVEVALQQGEHAKALGLVGGAIKAVDTQLQETNQMTLELGDVDASVKIVKGTLEVTVAKRRKGTIGGVSVTSTSGSATMKVTL